MTDVDRVNAGAALAGWRAEIGASPETCAAMLDCSAETYGRIEAGDIAPGADLALRIAAMTHDALPMAALGADEPFEIEGPLVVGAHDRALGRWIVRLLGVQGAVSFPPVGARRFAEGMRKIAKAGDSAKIPMPGGQIALDAAGAALLADDLDRYADLVEAANGDPVAAVPETEDAPMSIGRTELAGKTNGETAG